jgi:hypothetical protein
MFEKTKTFYACGVDWDHEMGEASDLEGKMPLYSSIEELKEHRSCWTQCGIVEIKLELSKWVKPPNPFTAK